MKTNYQTTANEDRMTAESFSVAPMMDWTDRHCRYFMRLLSPSVFLYTEMVTAAAIHHGDADRFLRFDELEHPIALQLGGSKSEWMASATKIASTYAYDEININVSLVFIFIQCFFALLRYFIMGE